jgi:hypothetical protein
MGERPDRGGAVLDRSPSYAAHQRRYRQRQRQREIMVTIGFSPNETAILRRLN